MTLEQEIAQILEDAKAQIRQNLETEGVNASGRTSASFRVVVEPEHIKLVGGGPNCAPVPTLEIGRPGGNVPGGFRRMKNGDFDVSNTFKWILIKWGEEKGVPIDWGGATMLGRRIAEKGTLRHINGGVDIYSTVAARAVASIRAVMQSSTQNSLRAAMLGMQVNSIKGNF